MQIYIIKSHLGRVRAAKTLTTTAAIVGKSRSTIRKAIEAQGIYSSPTGIIVEKIDLE